MDELPHPVLCVCLHARHRQTVCRAKEKRPLYIPTDTYDVLDVNSCTVAVAAVFLQGQGRGSAEGSKRGRRSHLTYPPTKLLLMSLM
jgi:hypothetical protein